MKKNTIRNYQVVQSNELTQSRNQLTNLETKIYACLLSQVSKSDDDFQPYRMKVADFQEDIETKSKAFYREVQKATLNLIKTAYEIKQPDGSILQISLLSSAQYFPGRGEVELQFDPKLKPYLLSLKDRFTLYNPAFIYQLKTRYGQRFYQYFCQYSQTGWWQVGVDKLRWMLSLDESYKDYNKFRARILEAAREDLQRIGIQFTYEENKKGRRVESIRFHFVFMEQGDKAEPQNSMASPEQPQLFETPPQIERQAQGQHNQVASNNQPPKAARTLSSQLIQRLKEHHLSDAQIALIENIHDPQLEKKLHRIMYDMQLIKVHSKPAYLWATLRKNYPYFDPDYTPPKELKEQNTPEASSQTSQTQPMDEQEEELGQRWQQCLNLLQENLESTDYQRYFSCLQPVSWSAETRQLTIQAPSVDHVRQLEQHHFKVFKQALIQTFGKGVQVMYVMSSTLPQDASTA